MADRFQFTATLEGDLTSLSDVARRAADLTPVLEGPVDEFVSSIVATVYRYQGAAYGGSAWRPLSLATQRGKLERGTLGLGMMFESGALKRSLTDAGDSNAIRSIGPASYLRGTSLPYAARAMSARPLFPTPVPNTVETIAGMISRYVATGALK